MSLCLSLPTQQFNSSSEERDMSLFMQPKFVASSASFMPISAHAHANTPTASKRTVWYRALADQGTWSHIG